MLCDACGTKYALDDGSSGLRVTPPSASFDVFRAYAAVSRLYESREALILDLCRACTVKVLAHLGLSTDVCELPQLPTVEAPDPPSGALSEKDLKDLGL